jgi:hypothetical protein
MKKLLVIAAVAAALVTFTACKGATDSVRNAADRLIAPVAEMLNRYALITAEKIDGENGSSVHLALSDGECTLLDMRLYCPDANKALQIKKNFRRSAEEYYKDFVTMLSEKRKKDH